MQCAAKGETFMATIERRTFVKGATLGTLAFSVGGSTVMLTARQARARNVPFRLLKEAEADIIESIGDTLVQGARAAGVAHFIDHQVSVPPEEALLQARIFNVRPPFVNFYRAAVTAIDEGSKRLFGYKFTEATPDQQIEFVHNMRQNKVEGWQGPPAPFVYTILRSDAVDVVYGTMEGYEMLGIPYQAHIAPEKRW
jgi:gluconate 2-dehydrogenase subunit 3-like protein